MKEEQDIHSPPTPEQEQLVEQALLRRIQGLEYTEVKESESVNRKTGEREVLITRTTKYLPPDISCAIFWLTNRRPDLWKQKPQEEREREGRAEPGGGVVLLPPVEEESQTPEAEQEEAQEDG